MTTQPASSATCFRLEPADFGASESEWNDWGWQYANRIRRPEDLKLVEDRIRQALQLPPYQSELPLEGDHHAYHA